VGVDWKPLAANKEELKTVKYNDVRLDSFASDVETKYNLPQGIVEALKNAGERSNTGQVSPAGAKGVMQFMDKTREAYQHDVDNPLASIDASGRYMADLLKQYKGNAIAAIAAYNGGTAAGNAVLAGKEPPAKETRDYIARIKKYMQEKEV
jgi:soluble lytic murein transglycosylase-like protein